MNLTPAALRSLARRDPALGRWIGRLPRFPGFPDRRQPRQATHFQALASAIVYQQLSTRAATTIWERVSALTPGPRFPLPGELRRLGPDRLRSAGLSRAKVSALLDLAARIEDGRLPLSNLGRRDDARVIEELVAVRGIGTWSAQMFLIFRLGRLDVLAGGDLGLQEGLRLLDGLERRPGPKELLARGAVWAPLRSVASWYLWRLVEHQRAAGPANR